MKTVESFPIEESKDERKTDGGREYSGHGDGLEAESRKDPEQKIEVEAIKNSLEEISETADMLEESTVENFSGHTEETYRRATILGKVRDLAYRLSHTLVLVGLFLGGGSFNFQNQDEEDITPGKTTQVETTRSEAITYGSAEYRAKLDALKQKLAAAGFKAGTFSGKEYIENYKILLNFVFTDRDQNANEIRNAILDFSTKEWKRTNEQRETEAKASKVLKESSRIPQERFEDILAKAKCRDVLQESAHKFGIDPLRRLGYHRYNNFNRDVVSITKSVNDRIEKLNGKNNTAYPTLTPGLLAAIALQEGFARIIDEFGYNPSAISDSFGEIGLDALGTEMGKLIAEGLLPAGYGKELKEEEEITFKSEVGLVLSENYRTNEAGMRVLIARAPQRVLLEGVAAIVADKRKTLIDNIGIDGWGAFDADEQNWLTYAAYQFGEGNVIRLVRDGKLHVRGRNLTGPKKIVLIEKYPKYRDGKPIGHVENIHDYIFKDSGRNFKTRNVHDFHAMAAQVAVSAKASDAFFAHS